MKNHVWRPLLVVIGLVVLILAARLVLVPDDFGVHDTGYMYGWYRQGNVEEWKVQPAKYRYLEAAADCAGCHEGKENAAASPHAAIACENCHGPAADHPDEPERLLVDRSRDLCLRCHAYLPYPTSDRAAIVGIDPLAHNPGLECADCHDPHDPNLEAM